MRQHALRRAVGFTVGIPLAAGLIAIAGAASLGTPSSPAPLFAQMTATHTTAHRPLVIKITVANFGRVLATPSRLPLYTSTREMKDHKIHCVGSCATIWPPLDVARGVKVPRRIAGITGTFGTIKRPNRTIQLTRNKLPL